MEIWCSTCRRNLLKVFDADSGAVGFAYNDLGQAISVYLPVDNQVIVCVRTCVQQQLLDFFIHLVVATRNGNILIFQDSDTTIKARILSEIIYPFYTIQYCNTIKAHDDTVHSGYGGDRRCVTGSGSMDGRTI